MAKAERGQMGNNLYFYTDDPSSVLSQHPREKIFLVTDDSTNIPPWSLKYKNIIFIYSNDKFEISEYSHNNSSIIIVENEEKTLSKTMIKLHELDDVDVYAPETSHYFQNRQVFYNSVPKCGTHLLANCFRAMGFKSPSVDRMPNLTGTPEIGTAYNLQHMRVNDLSDQYHKIGNFIDAISSSVIVFIVRDPRDVIVSLAHYIPRQYEYHILSNYFNNLSLDERISNIIRGDYLIPLLINEYYSLDGNIKSLFDSYERWGPRGWPNLWLVRYEDLIGANGFGTTAAQLKAVWGLQLALHVPGAATKLAEQVFSEESPTFFKALIGQYQAGFSDANHQALASLPADFMHRLGYADRWLIDQSFAIELTGNEPNLAEFGRALFGEISTRASGAFRACVGQVARRAGGIGSLTIMVKASLTDRRVERETLPLLQVSIGQLMFPETGTAYECKVSYGKPSGQVEPLIWTAKTLSDVSVRIMAACAANNLCQCLDYAGSNDNCAETGEERYRWFCGEIAKSYGKDFNAQEKWAAEVFSSEDTAYRYFNHLEKLIEERDGRLRALEQTLDERTVRLRSLELTLEERTVRLRSLELTLEECDRRLVSMELALRGLGERYFAAPGPRRPPGWICALMKFRFGRTK